VPPASLVVSRKGAVAFVALNGLLLGVGDHDGRAGARTEGRHEGQLFISDPAEALAGHRSVAVVGLTFCE
jgi:hypothetical protein